MPDLAVASITVPSSAATGSIVDLSWIAGNYGTCPVGPVTWYDRVVLSPNDTYGDSDDIELRFDPHSGPLGVGDVYSGPRGRDCTGDTSRGLLGVRAN